MWYSPMPVPQRMPRWERSTEESYDFVFDVNVKGVLFTVQKALPLMRDGGSIILTSSIVGSRGASPATSIYSATKAPYVRSHELGQRI